MYEVVEQKTLIVKDSETGHELGAFATYEKAKAEAEAALANKVQGATLAFEKRQREQKAKEVAKTIA